MERGGAVVSVVPQLCNLSSLIFALVVDWVMKRVISGQDIGLRLVNGNWLGTWTLQMISPCWNIPGRA